MNIAVFGAGKLGSPLIAVLASCGHTVIGVDTDRVTVEDLTHGRTHIEEPGLAELIEANQERISAVHVSEAGVAITQSDVVFVVVPTPSQDDGTFSCEHVVEAAQKIGGIYSGVYGYRLFVLVSTVMPGHTRGEFMRTIEGRSGKTCGVHFGVCYSPEFIALGSVIHDMLSPDLVLIGESDNAAGDKLEFIYNSVCPDSPVCRMGITSAEVAKLALNCYITTKISYANYLAEVCDEFAGADVHDVTEAIGLDTRIGSKCLQPATAYGGPCFPRDNIAFIALSKRLGCTPSLAEATHAINQRQHIRLADIVAEAMPAPGTTVGILGTAYKAGTGITEESAGVHLANELQRRRLRVITSDPLAKLDTDATSAQECVAGSDVVVVMLPCPEFAKLDYTGKVVIDCWGIIKTEPKG